MSPFYRSEAFAEDLQDAPAAATQPRPSRAAARWIVNALPVAVALLGVAFAVIPPLS